MSTFPWSWYFRIDGKCIMFMTHLNPPYLPRLFPTFLLLNQSGHLAQVAIDLIKEKNTLTADILSHGIGYALNIKTIVEMLTH